MSQPTHTNLIVGIQDLDFEGIKANLIRFLKDNNDFPDAAYTGSAFNTLLDVMAYNTHYQMLYANFTMNEAFLDSCSKYTSAVSLSKSLGYVPYSVTAASRSTCAMVFKATAISFKASGRSAFLG